MQPGQVFHLSPAPLHNHSAQDNFSKPFQGSYHLRKEEYFNTAKYPTINFVSTAITASNVTGNLTIKGVTKQISFPFTVKPSAGGYLFEGSFEINRRDFGIGGGSVSLSNNATVNLKVQAK